MKPSSLAMPTPRLPLHLLLALSGPLSFTACATTAPEKPPVIVVAAEPTDRSGSLIAPIRTDSTEREVAARDEFAARDDDAPTFTGPRPDVDGDGILNTSDACPDEPEDRDGFQDEDGCPDIDNDADGIVDRADLCPNEPESKNGFQDEDGCPDDSVERAKLSFREGNKAFTQGDYAKACKFFEDAYNFDPREPMLFNMAVCFDKLNDRKRACQYYNQWRATTSAGSMPNRIPSLETCP